MMQRVYMTSITILYQVVRSLRYTVLQSTFGVVSHCPHTPTCGTRLVVGIQKKSKTEIQQAVQQTLRCWGST